VRTPEQTLAYENLIAWTYQNECLGKFPEDIQIRMTIKAFYKIPKSASKKKKTDMKYGIIRPTKKPDIDNVVKVYADALNETAYHDDTQIVSIICDKYYSDEPRVEVTLEDIAKD
jgi:Holliday junction resolvase RusA-like endonuclease